MLIDIMKKIEKIQSDIVAESSHHAGYVSKFIGSDVNHKMDVAEQIANSIDCRVEIAIVPKSHPPVFTAAILNSFLSDKNSQSAGYYLKVSIEKAEVSG